MRMILPPTYLLVSLVLATALSVFLPGPRIVASPWTVIGIGLIVIGVGINIVGDRQFQRAKTTMNPFGSPRTLVTTGVFRCFPHPMYAGLVLIVIGTAVLLGYATPFIAPVLLWTVLRYRFIPQEERVLSQRFGEEYRVYRTRVSRWL